MNTKYGFSFDTLGLEVYENTAWIGPHDLSETWSYSVGDPRSSQSADIIVRDPEVVANWSKEKLSLWSLNTEEQANHLWLRNLENPRAFLASPPPSGSSKLHVSSTSLEGKVSALDVIDVNGIEGFNFTISPPLMRSDFGGFVPLSRDCQHFFFDIDGVTVYVTSTLDPLETARLLHSFRTSSRN